MGNALFRKLFHSVLMNEAAPAESGGGSGDGEPATAPEPAQQGGGEPAATDPTKTGAEPEKPSGEQKTEAEIAAEKAAAEEAAKNKKPEGAPEKYEFQAGEGTELDADALKDFEPVARELNLSNEQAQKLVDAYPKILAGVQQRQTEAWQATTEQWAADVKADKEIGGDKLTGNLSVAQRALDQFGTPELKEYLNTTGLGNHPDLVKTFIKIGKAMSEDGMVSGGKTTTQSVAQRMYPNMNP